MFVRCTPGYSAIFPAAGYSTLEGRGGETFKICSYTKKTLDDGSYKSVAEWTDWLTLDP